MLVCSTWSNQKLVSERLQRNQRSLLHVSILPSLHLAAAAVARQTNFDVAVNADAGNRLLVNGKIAANQRKARLAPHQPKFLALQLRYVSRDLCWRTSDAAVRRSKANFAVQLGRGGRRRVAESDVGRLGVSNGLVQGWENEIHGVVET